jgi:hypothetical protein
MAALEVTILGCTFGDLLGGASASIFVTCALLINLSLILSDSCDITYTISLMASDRDRDLRSLAKRYGISFVGRLSSERWPLDHTVHFKNIYKIEKYRYDSYCADINFRSGEFWRKHTKQQAKWLANRAIRLSFQGRNEAGWRFNVENDIFRRFQTEVTWQDVLQRDLNVTDDEDSPRCPARIWRSEIEASHNESDDWVTSLKERRKNREACRCTSRLGSLD